MAGVRMDDTNQVLIISAILIGTSTGSTKKITKFRSDVQTLRIKRNTKPWKERKLRKAKSQR